MMKEQRYALKYELANGTVKTCYPKSEEKKNENLAYCKSHGIKVISCKKLYPFSTLKNQHNFELMSNICFNIMHDMISGEINFNEHEYDRLDNLKEKADKFFCLELPVAWLPYEEWRDAKEISQMAIIHRQEACIRNGRYDLVTYC